MKNRIAITSDGINAYATIQVNASRTGIRILIGFLIVELFLIGGVLFNIKGDEVLSMVIPIIFILILFVGMPVKYLLWNLYGNEHVIVNSKSISWNYDYGFFRTNLKTIKYYRLGTGFEEIREENEKSIGKLIFFNYREEDNLPEVIHATTILLSKEEIEDFDNQIHQIFTNEFYDKSRFIPFSNN